MHSLAFFSKAFVSFAKVAIMKYLQAQIVAVIKTTKSGRYIWSHKLSPIDSLSGE